MTLENLIIENKYKRFNFILNRECSKVLSVSQLSMFNLSKVEKLDSLSGCVYQVEDYFIIEFIPF
jgi:hypothetical protein